MSIAVAVLVTVSDLERRLDNWGHCMRLRKEIHETPSKESEYRCPQRNHWNPPGAPTGPSSAPNFADALVIDRAVSALPRRYAIALRAYYVGQGQRDRMLAIARKIGFARPTLADVDAVLAMGRAMLARQLELPAVFRNPRSLHFVDPLTD